MTTDAMITAIFVFIVAIPAGFLIYYPPRSRLANELRVAFFAAGSLVLIAMYALTHSALATTKTGDFWVFEPTLFGHPLGGFLQLPHPYDYYLYQALRWGFFILLPAALATSVLYFIVNRRARSQE